MAAARVSVPGLHTTAVDTKDYSAYTNMSEEELLQVAIELSLAEAKPTMWQNRYIRSHTQPPPAQYPSVQRRQNLPPPADPPANSPVNLSANPPSEKECTKIDRDVHNHYFSKDKNEVIAWTRQNGYLQVTVEPMKNLDPFLSSIWKGDAKALRKIVQEKSINLTEDNKDGWIPLHECAYYGHVECLKVLLEAKPETINNRTLRNQTPLLLAVGRKHLACVQYLLEKGADPNLANSQWETPLYKACEKGFEEAVGLLLRYGATATKSCVQGGTPLHEAVINKNLQVCKMLLQSGAKLMSRNIYGIDSLFTAAQCGATEVLSFLLMKGADVNTQANDGASALFEACKNGHEEVVGILLSKRADVNKSNKAGLLPIHVAAKNGHDGIVAMLIPRTSRAKIRHCGISPLHLAAERNRDDILETLINAGMDVNFILSDNWSKMYEDRRSTALYFAVVNSNNEAAAMLLEAGANPNLDIFNPLLVAVRKSCLEMVKLLVKHGANVNAVLPTHPTTFPAALIFCTEYMPMLKYLMDNGCDALSCFKCNYGSKTHPSLKPQRNGREGQYYISDEHSEDCIQFCELVSNPKTSLWVGPIIDVLLDYVGHVKLCSRVIEHLDGYSDWAIIKEKSMPPRPLMHLCRLKIRQQMGINRLRRINTLPLPERLIKFLSHRREYFGDIL
ncbi:ankyrin repeat and SOCS box protein 2-like [Electrophorus electricus]|uniref:SOCS box domain-containing protein n=1 Tax=Electrophorus electricus TaxID=8005 RepID=A0A4W4FLB8_ELEEL|nr:ankyrin repeat and SOCS box protein 2-like [Electrophorus electricus]